MHVLGHVLSNAMAVCYVCACCVQDVETDKDVEREMEAAADKVREAREGAYGRGLVSCVLGGFVPSAATAVRRTWKRGEKRHSRCSCVAGNNTFAKL